jgi:hypothetical protein
MTTIVTEQQIADRVQGKAAQSISKTKMILRALQRGEKLTGKDIWIRFGVYRASSVINRLRNRGHNIITVMREGANGEQYARYEMVSSN